MASIDHLCLECGSRHAPWGYHRGIDATIPDGVWFCTECKPSPEELAAIVKTLIAAKTKDSDTHESLGIRSGVLDDGMGARGQQVRDKGARVPIRPNKNPKAGRIRREVGDDLF